MDVLFALHSLGLNAMFSAEADKRILGLGLIEYITVQNTVVQNRIDYIDTE